jgi:cytochrome c oxidase subunit 2
LRGAADTREEFAGLASLYLWVISAAVAVVALLVVFALVRYRARDARGPARGKSERNVAESLYALGLTAIAVVLIGATFHVENRVDPTARADLHVDVTAFQWGWRFSVREDPAQKDVIGTSDNPPELRVPAGKTIQFTVTSRDVIHSFWIPTERFKRDAFPGKTSRFDLVFDEPGVYRGHCAEFCGLEHADMDFAIRVTAA